MERFDRPAPRALPTLDPAAVSRTDRERLCRALAARRAEQAALRAGRAERLARLRTRDPEGRPLALLLPAGTAPPAAPSAAPPAAPPAAARIGTGAGNPDEADDGGDTALAASMLRDGDALERLLAELTDILGPAPGPDPGPGPEPAAVMHFPRTVPTRDAAAAPGAGHDLRRLPGAGPGLVAALVRAGVADLASLAILEPEDLAARLGPLGRLVDPGPWIDLARGWSGAATQAGA